jgi:hypothetical protein
MGLTVSSGDKLSLRLSIHSLDKPSHALLLAKSVDVRITKRLRTLTNGTYLNSRVEELPTENTSSIDVVREGHVAVQLLVQVGKPGKEQSWAVGTVVESLVCFH